MLINFDTQTGFRSERPRVDPSGQEKLLVVYSFQFSLAATADNLFESNKKLVLTKDLSGQEHSWENLAKVLKRGQT